MKKTDDELYLKLLSDIFKEVAGVNEKIGKLPCQIHTFQINLLQKIVFTAVGLILVGVMGSLGTIMLQKNINPARPAMVKPINLDTAAQKYVSLEKIEIKSLK